MAQKTRKKNPRTTVRRRHRFEAGAIAAPEEDVIGVEEPLEIRIQGRRVAVLMRTPGDDRHLAAGFLFTEGIVRSGEDLGKIRAAGTKGKSLPENVVDVAPGEGSEFDTKRRLGRLPADAPDGVSGTAAIDRILAEAPPLQSETRVKLETIFKLSEPEAGPGEILHRTTGLHAAVLCDAGGEVLLGEEDIARENAVDKIIGAMLLRNEVPLEKHILLVSGRVTFEICRKAMMASIPVLCAGSAPSSLAVEFANRAGMTLVGFLRGEEMSVYSGAGRLLG